jgi:hypothetical protein
MGGWAQAASFYQLQGATRTYPRSGSVEAHWYFNERLWNRASEEQNWNYGLIKAGGFVAAHGQAGLKIDVYPISFWQLSWQRSLTSRFYETLTLDCQQVTCDGILDRQTLKTSLVFGYGDFFVVPSYSLTQLRLDSQQKDFASEEDNLVADRRGDQVGVQQWALGYRRGRHRWLLVHKATSMQVTKDFNNSQYLIWNYGQNAQTSYFVGGGVFESNHASQSTSLVMGISWSAGENLALF